MQEETINQDGRVFNYNRSLIPNGFIREKEEKTKNISDAKNQTGLSVGYPSWNLLYYSLACSLPENTNDSISVIETGTNKGFSTIMLAQVLKDFNRKGSINTIDIDEANCSDARKNFVKAEVDGLISLHQGDSLKVLPEIIRGLSSLHFVFLDGSHKKDHILMEFSLIHDLVCRSKGIVFFDNTTGSDVRDAINIIKSTYGGNVVEFRNCSWSPPGNALWQP